MSKHKDKLFELFIIAACYLVSGLLSIYLGQDRNWDLRNYHFYNAYAFLNDRLTFDIAPAQIQSFFNPLLYIPYYWMITHLRPVIYGFLVGGLQGINIWFIYKIAHCTLFDISRTKKYLLSLSAGITGYYGAANISEIGTTFSDNVTSLFVLGGLLLTVSSLQKNLSQPLFFSKKTVIISGFLLGCATGLKLTTAIYSISFVVSILLISSPWRNRIKNTLLSSLSVCIGIITTMGYWMTVLWMNFRSPLFPFYNKLFKSPYYDIKNFVDDRFLPRDIYQTLFYPFYFIKSQRLVSEGAFRDIRLAVCYMLLALLLFVIFYRWVNAKYGFIEISEYVRSSSNQTNILVYLIVFFVSSYIFWQQMFSIYRYIIPLELLSPVLIILIIRYIFPFEKILTQLSLAIFALIIITMSPIHWGRITWAETYFDVKIPSLENLDKSIVIMADDEPLSYIIPFFPKSTRFVSVQNNFMNPFSKNLLQAKIREILQHNNAKVYLLYKEKSQTDYEGVLKFYNLKIAKHSFQRLYTRIDKDLLLFPVSQIK